jgi:hypothetical protein
MGFPEEKDKPRIAFIFGLVIIAIFAGVLFYFSNVNGILIAAVTFMLLLALISAINLCANGDKWSETPFGLPKGTIRASITLIFIIIVFLGAFNIDNIGAIADSMPEWLLAILGTIIGFYFGERKGAEAASDEDEATESYKNKVNNILDDAKITDPQKKVEELNKLRK